MTELTLVSLLAAIGIVVAEATYGRRFRKRDASVEMYQAHVGPL